MHSTTLLSCRAAVPSPAPARLLRRLGCIHSQTLSDRQQRNYTSPPHTHDTRSSLPRRSNETAQAWQPRYSPSQVYRHAPIRSRWHSRYYDGLDTRTKRQRSFSTSRMQQLWDFLSMTRKPPVSQGTQHLPPLASFLDDSQIPGRILKSTNELRIRCTEFDENGNVTLVNGEFKKSELIAKYGLLPRDLRKIDSTYLPHILVRPSAILVNLLHLRVLIKNDRVLVFDAYGSTDSYTQSVFMYDLEGKLRQIDARSNGSLPYEFRALEAILISVTTGLESEFEGVRDPVVRVLRELEEDIDRDKLRYLLVYSKKLGTFEQKARLVRDALEELLEADDDLADMYLSDKATGKDRPDDDHTEIEMLLESYHKVTDEIVQAAENLVSNIRNTEEIVRAILDANRNSLMLLDLKFSIATLGLGAGTFIAALYGMNLKNFIEESDLGFWGVSGVCAALSVIVLVYGMRRLRAVQRISMWGNDSRAHMRKHDETRGHWGIVRGTAAAGMGALADPTAARSKKLADKISKARDQQMQQATARKRAQAQAKNEAACASDRGADKA